MSPSQCPTATRHACRACIRLELTGIKGDLSVAFFYAESVVSGYNLIAIDLRGQTSSLSPIIHRLL